MMSNMIRCAKLFGVFAVAAATAFHAAPAAAEGPAVTPLPEAGVTIVLPSGAVITLPVEQMTPMPHDANQDHVVGEDLC